MNSANMQMGYEWDLRNERNVLLRVNGLVVTGLLTSLQKDLDKVSNAEIPAAAKLPQRCLCLWI